MMKRFLNLSSILILVVGLSFYLGDLRKIEKEQHVKAGEKAQIVKSESKVVEKDGLRMTFSNPRYGNVAGLNKYGFLVTINFENLEIEPALPLGGDCDVSVDSKITTKKGYFIQLLDEVRIGESWHWDLLILLEKGEQVERCRYNPNPDINLEIAFDQASIGEIKAETETRLLSDEEWQLFFSQPLATLGDPEAPVKIVEFLDYQCPYCKEIEEEVSTRLKTDYIETGKAYLVLLDLPVANHDKSLLAAVAARCADQEGKFWEMHDALLANQTVWSELELSEAGAQLAQYGDELGIDIRECQADQTVQDQARQNLFVANKVGVVGTPVMVINKQVQRGAQPYLYYQNLIEAELEKLTI